MAPVNHRGRTPTRCVDAALIEWSRCSRFDLKGKGD
jgi:hypothetical protein